MYDVDSDTNTWAVNGRKNGVLSIPTGVMATSEVVLSLIPQTGGNLAMPEIKLMKYVEKDATLPQAKNIEGAGVNASETLSNQQSPLILPFTCGQVYNKTAAVRVSVLPSNNPDLAWIWTDREFKTKCLVEFGTNLRIMTEKLKRSFREFYESLIFFWIIAIIISSSLSSSSSLLLLLLLLSRSVISAVLSSLVFDPPDFAVLYGGW